MRYLVDTHVILWYASGDRKLSTTARDAMDSNEVKVLSCVSLWEMAIKMRLKKLQVPDSLEVFARNEVGIVGYELLRIEPEHVYRLSLLDLHHRDPFDRLLAAQALSEDLNLISRDSEFDAYGVKRVW